MQPFKRWVWCYKCDDFIAPDATPKLVDMMKQMKPHLDKFVKRYEERTGEKAMPPPEVGFGLEFISIFSRQPKRVT